MSKRISEPDRVEVFVPRASARDDANLFVSVNGVSYLLPRGKSSMVPRAVKAEIDRAAQAAEQQEKRIEELLKAQ